MNMKKIGDFLKSLRKSKGLTQTELADMLNVSNKTISKWENGLGIPEMSTLLLLADIYEVSVDDILRGSKKMPKSEDKTIDRLQYLLHKSKHQYFNHLILSFSIIISGFIAFSISSALDKPFIVTMSLTLTFAVASLIIQLLNINRIRYQLVELREQNDYTDIFKVVFNTSFFVFLMAVWLSIFVFIRYYFFVTNVSIDAMFYSSIMPAFAIASIQTIFSYLIVRFLFRNKLKIQLSKIHKILIGSFLTLLVFPFLTISIFSVRNVAIAVEWSGINQSIYEISDQEKQYYNLRLLWMIDETIKNGSNPDEIYEVIMHQFYSNTSSVPTIYYHFTEPTTYDLYIDQSYFDDFLISHNYSNFDVSDEVISAYWFSESDTVLTYEIYGYLFGNLLSLWFLGGVVLFFLKRSKKQIE